MSLSCWIEATRLRTLPVSIAGVILAIGYARLHHSFAPAPALLCLTFAILAQIASNFANEYYDFRAGLDRPGREGPRRGVTEGDITPRAMLAATFITLGAACAVGCSLLLFGPWWLLPAGIAIALGVLAYSTGPYPLSRHGLGEVAAVLRHSTGQPHVLHHERGVQSRGAARLPVSRIYGCQRTACQQLPRCRRRPFSRQAHSHRNDRPASHLDALSDFGNTGGSAYGRDMGSPASRHMGHTSHLSPAASKALLHAVHAYRTPAQSVARPYSHSHGRILRGICLRGLSEQFSGCERLNNKTVINVHIH